MHDIFGGDLVEQTLRIFAELRSFDEMMFVENRWFGYVDSAVYFSIIKLYRPKQIIEVGSGYSTGIARQAREGQLVCIDPNPKADIDADMHITDRVETLSLDVFDDCDLLFVDSSHAWEAGDLPFIFEKVLPWLKIGTLIHFHDIFLPDDYSQNFAARGYNEQYHLRDFLEANSAYKTLWPAYYMATWRTKEVKDIFGTASSMGSFWLVKAC